MVHEKGGRVKRVKKKSTWFMDDHENQGLTSVCEFSTFRHFFKVLLKHEMWSFSIKFGKLRYNNVNNTFMIKRNFT